MMSRLHEGASISMGGASGVGEKLQQQARSRHVALQRGSVGGGRKSARYNQNSLKSSVYQALRQGGSRVRLVRKGLGGGFIPEISTCESAAPTASSSSSATDGKLQRHTEGDSQHTVAPSSAVPPAASVGTSQRWKRQVDIAHILPVSDVLSMTRHHWEETFALERRYLPTDWSSSKECGVIGVKQCNVNRNHRHRIVNWMSEACTLFRWASQTFFTAVHAWDSYMTLVPHQVATEDLAKLSAACLYFGAQLVESAADENVKTLDEFAEMCPEVGGAAALREIEAHLVDTLQGISLVRRTPADFLMLFLAQLQIAPSPCPQLFHVLIQKNLLDVLWDFVLAVALAIYSNGLVLDGLPGSRWVAGTMLRVLEFCCPPLRTDAEAREILREKVFHMPPGVLEQHQTTILDPIIKCVWHLVVESVMYGRQTPSTTEQRTALKRPPMPYDVIRHQLPPSFTEWPITFPSYRVVQDVSTRLRAATFETCTPPNLHPSGTSASASKRGVSGDKPRRQSQEPVPKNSRRAALKSDMNDVDLPDANDHQRPPGATAHYHYGGGGLVKKPTATAAADSKASLIATPNYPAEA